VNSNGELQECVRCGCMFFYSGNGKRVCTKCKEEDEAQFNLVKEYIYNNLSATIMEVSKETGVRVVRIKSYLRDGRLVIPDGSAVFLNFEVCGTSIKFGRVCKECARNLSNEMKNAMKIDDFCIGETPNLDAGVRMRFIGRE
jgi:hypothetical protein